MLGFWTKPLPTPILHVLLSNERVFVVNKGSFKCIHREKILNRMLESLRRSNGKKQSVTECSLNVVQRLSQLYIVLRTHYTRARLARMGLRWDPTCISCGDHGDLTHLIWRCPNLHFFWKKVIDTLHWEFQVQVPEDPKQCLLDILDNLPVEDTSRQAIAGTPFQARKLILRH